MHELPELRELEDLIDCGAPYLRARTATQVQAGGRSLPVHVLSMGSDADNVPVIAFFGGVHGLERVGTHVLISFLASLLSCMRWDSRLQELLGQVRLVFMPLVNPGGMLAGTRCNPNGVDLMRNAPLDAIRRTPLLVGGQRLSPRLPWYRGPAGEPMEAEAQALCDVVRQELLTSSFSVALDCHSGFGMRDRIWFPLACSDQPIQHLPELHALWSLFEQAYPHHDYLPEPQSCQYATHGDLWDYLYLESLNGQRRIFLPLTLEMGSWRWVKKRPLQLFSALGLFNPMVPHRLQRVLRRHLVWFEFLARATATSTRWLPKDEQTRSQHHAAALDRWYRQTA